MSGDDWRTLLRGQRHAFLNHLQVISGWLQMGQADRARQYLQAVARRLEAGGALARAEPADLALALLLAAQVAESHAVELAWDLPDPLAASVQPDELRFLQRRLQADIEGAAGRGAGLGIRLRTGSRGELLVHTYDIPANPAGT